MTNEQDRAKLLLEELQLEFARDLTQCIASRPEPLRITVTFKQAWWLIGVVQNALRCLEADSATLDLGWKIHRQLLEVLKPTPAMTEALRRGIAASRGAKCSVRENDEAMAGTQECRIRHRVVLRHVDVELIDEAGNTLERLGHFFDGQMDPVDTRTFGPFPTREAARNDPHAWVEDV
jgi:hypothetical protein